MQGENDVNQSDDTQEQGEMNEENNVENDRGISGGNGFSNFIKNPFGAIGNKLKSFLDRKKGKRKSFIRKIWEKIPLSVKIYIILGIVIITLIVVIVIAIGDVATKTAVKNRDKAVNALGIDENSSKISQAALELYNTYDSLIGFSKEQLNTLNENFMNDKSNDNYYLLSSGKKKFGDVFGDPLSVDGEKTLYQHIQRTEKYNFNSIVWKGYTHSQDGISLQTEKNDELELIIPKDTDEDNLITLLKTTSPYILTQNIPLGLLCGIVGQSAGAASRETSLAEKLTYQSIKEALSKITVNKYELERLKFQTTYDEFNYNTYSSKYLVNIYSNGYEEIVSQEEPQITSSTDVVTTQESRVNGTEQYNYDIYWYVADAVSYDAEIKNNFDYKRYSDDDVNNLRNPDSNNLISTTEINEMTEINQPIRVESTGGGRPPNNNGGYEAPIRSETRDYVFTKKEGTTYYYEKEWKDKLNPQSTDYKLFSYDTAKSYHTKIDENYPDFKTDKTIISEEKFSNDNPSGSSVFDNYTKEDNYVRLKGMSIIDLLDSNSGIYKKYLEGRSGQSEYVGLGREELKSSYNQIRNILNTILKKSDSSSGEKSESSFNSYTTGIANEGTLPFVYGSSLGYEVTKPSVGNSDSSIKRGFDLLKEYIHSFEGTTGEKEENGVKYYRVGLVKGNRTVGYGLDLETSGLEPELLASAERAGVSISTAVDSWIPADLVDAFTDVEIENAYNDAASVTDGLDLEEYQLHALACRIYNCGKSGGTGTRGSYDFVQAYKAFWNKEADDKYEMLHEKYGSSDIDSSAESDILSNVNFNHGLYTNYMKDPVTSNGDRLEGLVKRRDSEWVLFQTGYYGYNTNLKVMYGGGGSILEAADYVHKIMEQNNFGYCLNGKEKDPSHGGTKSPHALQSTLEAALNGYPVTCCATYVSWVLQEAGYLDYTECIHGAINLGNYMINKGWTRIDDVSQMQPGDLMLYNYGHIEIYAGDNTIYNAGSNKAIKNASPQAVWNTPDYLVRAPN